MGSKCAYSYLQGFEFVNNKLMDEKTLFIINKISNNTYLKLNPKSFQEYKPQLNELIAKGFIKSNANGYSFTDIGYQIKEIGGYENYLNKLKQDKEIQENLSTATIDSANATVDSAKSAKASKNWGIFTSLVGLASFLWAIYQTSEVDSLKKDVQKSDSLLIWQGQVIEKQNQRLSKIEQTLNRFQSKK